LSFIPERLKRRGKNQIQFSISVAFRKKNSLTIDEIHDQIALMNDEIAFYSQELLSLETFSEKINLDGILPTNPEIVERMSLRKKKRGDPKKEKLNFQQKIEITTRLQNDLLAEMPLFQTRKRRNSRD
jgi:hypothetical protein